jgi:exosortase C (VPDSG-CTERM-specific)
MKEPLSNSRIADVTDAPATWQALPRPERLRLAAAAGWTAVATLAFIQPLTELMRYAAGSPLLSYIPLVPLVTAYLLYLRRSRLPLGQRGSVTGAVILCLIGSAAVLAAMRLNGSISANDRLALLTLSYVAIVAAGGFLCLGTRWMAAAAFPVSFLLFMVPIPDVAVERIETASVVASADVSAWLFRLTGTPLLRDGEVFSLPGIVLKIAQECSGIHSSWVLFMTSLVASQLFLDSPWRRLVLVAFVIPLAIVRNSVRIVAIGLLCVHIGPHMIDSAIHRHGGPVFFALSLIPLLGLLIVLRRQER